MRALCLLRSPPVYRREAVCHGLRAAGYEVVAKLDKPEPADVVLSWNRYGAGHAHASRFEHAGARCVVMENGHLGKDFCGDSWYALALGHHAGRGTWPHADADAWAPWPGDPPPWTARWDALGVQLQPWRPPGGETIVLHQRGIGEPGIASPPGWAERVTARIKGARMRTHPGSGNKIELEHDVRNASRVITWASGAALRCLVLGMPVWYEMHGWIGAPAAHQLDRLAVPRCDDAARLHMLRRLAWAQWRLSEIESGHAFRTLLGV